MITQTRYLLPHSKKTWVCYLMYESENSDTRTTFKTVYVPLCLQTDKSMIELELDCNQRLGEWSALQESNSELRPLYGPGYTGLINLGNTCYFNSVMQVVFFIKDFVQRSESVQGEPTKYTKALSPMSEGSVSQSESSPPLSSYRIKPDKKIYNKHSLNSTRSRSTTVK